MRTVARIKISDVLTNCSYGNKTYPAKDDEDVFPISNVTNNSFTFELEKSTVSHSHQTGQVELYIKDLEKDLQYTSINQRWCEQSKL
ncbi:MAG: hypothetical protein CM15mV5_0450 [uncultured marine virus]|nr:MAG: hypothetical protein CM15mV5_0450 [uncultured marine virus]